MVENIGLITQRIFVENESGCCRGIRSDDRKFTSKNDFFGRLFVAINKSAKTEPKSPTLLDVAMRMNHGK